MIRKCNKCGLQKSVEDFSLQPTSYKQKTNPRAVYRGECKACKTRYAVNYRRTKQLQTPRAGFMARVKFLFTGRIEVVK